MSEPTDKLIVIQDLGALIDAVPDDSIVSRGFGSLLRKVLPKGAGGTGTSGGASQGGTAPQQQQQQQPHLEDILPGLLDRLRR